MTKGTPTRFNPGRIATPNNMKNMIILTVKEMMAIFVNFMLGF